jgi:hypothetical protein
LILAVTGALTALSLCAVAAQAAGGPTVPTNDPFYYYSGSLAHFAPGTVLRHRTVNIAETGKTTPMTATQLLYRTQNQLGQRTFTVATVIRPANPIGATKIVSYQTAYDALGSQCDPSYTLQGGDSSYSTAQDEEQIILAYVTAGYTVVVPDYEGEQLHWAAGQESGWNTLDGIRAAENYLHLPQGSTPVGMVGYSGGSIATDFAGELAPSYAPGLDIVGVAEGGVPVDFFHNLAYINGSPSWSGVIPAVFVSLARAFGVNLSQYLNSYGLQVTKQVRYECINNFVGSYPGLTYQKLAKPQYQNIAKIASVVRITDKLIMSRTGTPKGPLFIGVGDADGTGDGVMVTKDDQELAHTYCQRGVNVQFNVYQGDDHTDAAVPFETGAFKFLTQRLNGQSVTNGCSSIGAGNSLAPVKIPSPAKVKTRTKLRFRDAGVKKRLHGLVIYLSTSKGTVGKLLVTLRRGRKVVGRVKVGKLTTHRKRIVLRRRGHRAPARGRYTLKVTEGRTTLLAKKLTIKHYQ